VLAKDLKATNSLRMNEALNKDAALCKSQADLMALKVKTDEMRKYLPSHVASQFSSIALPLNSQNKPSHVHAWC
jgi:ankyrin repeat protein